MKLWILLSAIGLQGLFGQDQSCLLGTARNGDLTKVRAEIYSTGHDVFLRLRSCKADYAQPVILLWSDDVSLTSEKRSPVKKDEAYFKYEKLVAATFPLPPNAIGVGQSRYRVTASFEGRLEVASWAGLRRDPKSQKLLKEGFGHPTPFTRYRLIARSVSDVEAKEQIPVVEHEAEHSIKPNPVKPK
jgi:hypothetical protein